MKKKYILVGLSVLVSLFIYLFYRTEKTVINDIFISIVSCEHYVHWKNFVTNHFALPGAIIYSLPEGLWVFSITLTSGSFFLRVGSHQLSLLFLPLVFSIGLELIQLLHLTNGRFDFMDIALSILFWAVARYYLPLRLKQQNIFQRVTTHSAVCISSYLIIYLAHVWK